MVEVWTFTVPQPGELHTEGDPLIFRKGDQLFNILKEINPLKVNLLDDPFLEEVSECLKQGSTKYIGSVGAHEKDTFPCPVIGQNFTPHTPFYLYFASYSFS